MFIWDEHISLMSKAKHHINRTTEKHHRNFLAVHRTGEEPGELECINFIFKFLTDNVTELAQKDSSPPITLETMIDVTLRFLAD